MKKLLFTPFLFLVFVGFSQTIPPPYINYQAVLYDVNSANPNTPLTNQSFTTFVNINDELGNLLYREEHYASTDANGLITVKIGDGAYVAGSFSNLNDINWGVGKYYLVVDFDINGTISSTSPEQLVTVPYSFYAGNAGNGISAIADNGNGTLTFVYLDSTTYITPILSGLQGPIGPAGPQGIQGITGATGPIGLTGPAGTAGTNGLNALIITTIEPAGANCTNGGIKIESGIDQNSNGVLDLLEINNSEMQYICNGTSWNSVPAGQTGQNLTICYGVPQWGPCSAEITTNSTTAITGISATSGGNITNSGGTAVNGRGVVYSTSPNPTLSNTIVSSGNGTGLFSVSLINLLPNTTYYVRAYANNSAGTTYGNQQVFTTQIILPTVTTVNNSIQSCSVVSLQGNLTTNGGENGTKVGFALSLNSTPTINDSIGSFVSSIGTFNQNAVSLSPNTLYYYRAFAKNQAGIEYGSILSFTTPFCLPSVVTNVATNVTHNSAIGNGELTDNGGDVNVSRGFCWATVATPTISNSTIACGTGTGVFSCSMTGLSSNTTYYYRAYATNGAGTSYGQIFSFKTKGFVLLASGCGTWTVPSGVTEITVECWGGGGSGQQPPGGSRGAGGGGGAYSKSTINVNPGDVYNFCVGSGGITNSASISGGDSFFGNPNLVLAKGGTGANSYAGGLGGSSVACIGQFPFSGGNGGNGNVGLGTTVGGGGGAAGPTGIGGDGGFSGGLGNAPGGNGGSMPISCGYGTSGGTYGGGGSGARRCGGYPNATGGPGENGAVIITFDAP